MGPGICARQRNEIVHSIGDTDCYECWQSLYCTMKYVGAIQLIKKWGEKLRKGGFRHLVVCHGSTCYADWYGPSLQTRPVSGQKVLK